MKQLCMMMLLTITLILVGGQVNQAEAYDQYCSVYKDGNEAYLMTETIRGSKESNFTCTVKAVKGRSVIYIDYKFWLVEYDGWYFSNSQGFRNQVSRQKAPVAWSIWEHCQSLM